MSKRPDSAEDYTVGHGDGSASLSAQGFIKPTTILGEALTRWDDGENSASRISVVQVLAARCRHSSICQLQRQTGVSAVPRFWLEKTLSAHIHSRGLGPLARLWCTNHI